MYRYPSTKWGESFNVSTAKYLIYPRFAGKIIQRYRKDLLYVLRPMLIGKPFVFTENGSLFKIESIDSIQTSVVEGYVKINITTSIVNDKSNKVLAHLLADKQSLPNIIYGTNFHFLKYNTFLSFNQIYYTCPDGRVIGTPEDFIEVFIDADIKEKCCIISNYMYQLRKRLSKIINGVDTTLSQEDIQKSLQNMVHINIPKFTRKKSKKCLVSKESNT